MLGLLEQAGLGAEGDQRGRLGVGAGGRRAAPLDRRRVRGRAASRRSSRSGCSPLGRDLVHRRLEAGGEGGSPRPGSPRGAAAGQVAELVAEAGVLGHHVVGDAALDGHVDCAGRCTARRSLVARVLLGETGADWYGSLPTTCPPTLIGVHRPWRERRLCCLALDVVAPVEDALVRQCLASTPGLARRYAGLRRDAACAFRSAIRRGAPKQLIFFFSSKLKA